MRFSNGDLGQVITYPLDRIDSIIFYNSPLTTLSAFLYPSAAPNSSSFESEIEILTYRAATPPSA
jgi:hypothetical protein